MSLKLTNTKKYLRQYAKTLLKLAYAEIERKDRSRTYKTGSIDGPIDASGSLKESLKLRGKKEDGVVYTYNITGNEYGEYVDEGTKKSTPPVEKLVNWLVSKNRTLEDINKNTVNLNDLKKVKRIAYAIQKSLSIRGIKRTGFLTDLVKKEFKKLNNIHNPVVKDIMSDLDNILKNAGYEKKGNETFTIETKVI